LISWFRFLVVVGLLAGLVIAAVICASANLGIEGMPWGRLQRGRCQKVRRRCQKVGRGTGTPSWKHATPSQASASENGSLLLDCKGKRDAQTACSKLITELKAGSYVEPSKLTLAQFFERWLKHIKPNVSPRTHERYEQIATKNIVPLLGAKSLSQLQPIDISEAYGKALESGRRDGKGGLSPAPSIICTGSYTLPWGRLSVGS
jgi:Phage integrase, N-terminal SAM-like domain